MRVLVMILEILQSVCGWVFIMAGFSKAFETNRFRLTLLQIPYLPYRSVSALSLAFPLLEVGVGICLMFGIFAAKIAAVILVFSFCIVSFAAIQRKVEIACNCFGNLGRSKLGLQTIYKNIVLLGFLILSFRIDVVKYPIHSSVVAGTLLLFVLIWVQIKENMDALTHERPAAD